MNIGWEINKLLPEEWYLESLCRLGEGDWQALVSDGFEIYRGTGDTIEDALAQAARGTRPIGTIFATSYAGDRQTPAKSDVNAKDFLIGLGVSKRYIVHRRI